MMYAVLPETIIRKFCSNYSSKTPLLKGRGLIDIGGKREFFQGFRVFPSRGEAEFFLDEHYLPEHCGVVEIVGEINEDALDWDGDNCFYLTRDCEIVRQQ